MKDILGSNTVFVLHKLAKELAEKQAEEDKVHNLKVDARKMISTIEAILAKKKELLDKNLYFKLKDRIKDIDSKASRTISLNELEYLIKDLKKIEQEELRPFR
jgi:hypothetical protein